jgi:hypothetical protein
MILVLGPTLDQGMHFGQASAVQTAQRRLSNILEIVYQRVIRRIMPWSLWTPEGLRSDVNPGCCWDFHPAVHAWRAQRYLDAIARGQPPHEAYMETFPLDVKGYIDDTMQATIILFANLFFEELLRYCDAIGILLSVPKFQLADAFKNLYTMDTERRWLAPVRGCLAPLGKLLKMNLELVCGLLTPVGVIIEKPARVKQIVRRTEELLAYAESHKGMISFDDYESIIGVYLCMATTIVAMVAVMQYPLRNLHTKFGLVFHQQFRRAVGKTIPLTRRAR